MERATGPNTSSGGILGRNGAYFLKRGAGERAAFLFENPMLYITKAHIMGLETLRRLKPRRRETLKWLGASGKKNGAPSPYY